MFLVQSNDTPLCSISDRRVRVTLVFPDLNCSDGYTVSTSEAYLQLVSLIIEKVEEIHMNTAHAHWTCALDMHNHLVQNALINF